MNQLIKIYTDVSIIPNGVPHTFMLIPLLGLYQESDSDPDKGRFDSWFNEGQDLIDFVVDPAESDYFLLPFGYMFDKAYESLIKSFIGKAKQYGKKVLVFYNADDDSPIDLEQSIVFRTSLNKSTKRPYEYAFPGWSVDFKKYFHGNKINYLDKQYKPSVSYCGYIDAGQVSVISKWRKWLSAGAETKSEMAGKLRGNACRTLQSNNSIDAHFIIRNGFWAEGLADKINAREEYAANFIGSMYALVARGGGNFSYRLYEVLSCGRIPLFINTDSVLPFEENVDWKKHVLWVEQNEVQYLDKILLEFHASKSSAELLSMQQSNRNCYEDIIAPTAFFKTLIKNLMAN